ncbi:MAG: hypothetical protein ACRCXT_08575 [Paraclostridium sp.]
MLRLPVEVPKVDIPIVKTAFDTVNPFAMLENWIKTNFCELIDATLQFINDISFNTCLIVGMVALILYVFGWNDCKKWATLSPVIYLLIRIIGNLIFGL